LVIAIIIRGWRIVMLMRHQSRCIGEDFSLSFLNIANGSILTLGPSRIVIDERRIYGSKLSISLNLNTLIPQHNPTLPLCSLQIDIFWIMNDLPTS